MSKRRDLETQFKKWLQEKQQIRIGNRLLSVLHTEYPLIKPMRLLTQNDWRTIAKGGCIGRIDLIIRFSKKIYVSECKYIPFEIENFWGAMKCLAYCAYYNWQRELENIGKAYPAMFLPTKIIKLEHKIIANKLGIALFGIEKNKDDWIVEAINFD